MQTENNIAEQKLLLFQKILSVKNEQKLNKLFLIVDKFITDMQDSDTELSFETWNQKYMNNHDLDEYIPEYQMTLGEYRQKIFKSETSKTHPIENFIEKLDNYAR